MRYARVWIVLPLVGIVSCGGSGGGSHPGSSEPMPTATSVAAATPTPAPTASLVLSLSATTDVIAASFMVGYEAGRVALVGSGAQAQCRLGSSDTLAVNDDDAGTLRVAVLPADPLQRQTLTLPTTLTCDFLESGGAITAGDLRVSGKKIGDLDAGGVVITGDPSQLTVQ